MNDILARMNDLVESQSDIDKDGSSRKNSTRNASEITDTEFK